MKEWLVYAHINKTNGKMYVGITSQSVQSRWGLNGNGYKDSPKFWNAIKKYGWDNFEHEIIAEHLTEQEAKNFEKALIKSGKLQDDKYGYNMTVGGDGVVGNVVSEETKEKLRKAYYNMSEESKKKLRESQIGMKRSDIHKKHISESCTGKGTKKVSQYELDGTFIKTWNSLTSASDNTDVQISDISMCCKNKRKHIAGGYQWRFSDGTENNIEPYVKDISRHKVAQCDDNDNILHIWNSLKEIKETLKINTNNIPSVCNGDRNKAYGYKWKYV